MVFGASEVRRSSSSFQQAQHSSRDATPCSMLTAGPLSASSRF